jgi:dipeptidyl aminopeptidase/acylaminoacyl peptidase
VGASFGGAAAIIASTSPEVDKAIALAPVVDWTANSKTEPFHLFVYMLAEGFGSAYRPVKDAYEKLQSGKFYQPMLFADKVDKEKLLIVQASDDTVVPLKALRGFAKAAKIKPIILPDGGHYGAGALLEKSVWDYAKIFLKSKKK